MKDFNVKRRSISIVLAAGTVVILLFWLWPSVWATPSQEPLRQATPTPKVLAPTPIRGQWGETVNEPRILPEEGRTFSSVRGDIVLAIPPGSLKEVMGIKLVPHTVEEAPAPGAGFRLLGHVFELMVYRQLDVVHGYVLAGPVGICIYYTDEDVTNAGGDPNSMVVVSYDEAKEEWVGLDTTIDTVARSACVEISHLSFFALAVAVGPGLSVVKVAIVALVSVLVLALAGFYSWRAKRVGWAWGNIPQGDLGDQRWAF